LTSSTDVVDIDAALAASPHVAEGEARVGGQQHFYLEPQASLAIPKGEKGEIELYTTTQVRFTIHDVWESSSERVVERNMIKDVRCTWSPGTRQQVWCAFSGWQLSLMYGYLSVIS
jgi:hypothetical protein